MKCYWCEAPITRGNPNLRWVDEYESSDCEFHPYAFDILALKTTNQSAPHQTVMEVHGIIKKDYEVKLAQRYREPLRAVEDNVVLLSRKASRTSRSAAEKILPRTGTLRRRVYDIILSAGLITDEELEKQIGGKHQSISACRRSLVIDGYIVDSGQTRKNSVGNECILWTHNQQTYTLFNDVR